MTYEVKTAVFEGPLDLLLQLITRHEVDITEVSLIGLVSEYVSYLDEMHTMDMGVTSEFLLIAATLIQLKARHLLPDDPDVDIDEDLALMEERDRLLARLLACVTFKDVAAVLQHRYQVSNRYVPRSAGLPVELPERLRDVRIGLNAVELATLAHRVFTRSPEEPDLDHLDLDLPSVEDVMNDLRIRVEHLAETTFEDIVEHCTKKMEVVAYFLALLELARWGMVEVAQEDWFSRIEITHKAGGNVGKSEWST
jgi:segregation and condensation protein A